MLYGIIADIHSNLEALEAVLSQLRQVDRIVCLGDIVGYGPDPNECIEIMQKEKIPSVAGNHDKAAIGEFNTQSFNENAKKAIDWTSGQLTASSRQYLAALPQYLATDGLEAVHGSLRDPLDEYVTNIDEAALSIELMKKNVCFAGHTHVPLYVGKKAGGGYDGRRLSKDDIVNLNNYSKSFINPGSVGQPRDNDPRASYGLFDSEKNEFTLLRTEYNIAAVQEKMRIVGLPQFLIGRLVYGQ